MRRRSGSLNNHGESRSLSVVLLSIAMLIMGLGFPQALYANPTLDRAQGAVHDSTSTALETLNQVRTQVPEEAVQGVDRAIQEVQDTHERALEGLNRAGDEGSAEAEGLAIAQEATLKHQQALRDVLAQLPDDSPARSAIQQAIGVSQQGHRTVNALAQGLRGQDLPRPDRSLGAPDRPNRPGRSMVPDRPGRPGFPDRPPRPARPGMPGR